MILDCTTAFGNHFTMPIIFPLAYLTLRELTKFSVNKAINRGIWKAAGQATARITSLFLSNSLVMAINIGVIILSVYFSKDASEESTSILIITSVYLSSVFYSAYSLILNIPTILRVVFEHKLNLAGYIESEIYSEAYDQARREINGLGIVEGVFNKLWGKSAHEIAHAVSSSSTGIVIEKMLITSIWFVISYVAYIAVFRMYVAPILVEDATGLTSTQAFFWPFAYSIDFYFGTELINYIKQ